MVRALLRRLVFVLPIIGISQPVSAQLAIDRLWVDLDDQGTTRSDLVIRNESSDVYYITVVASEVLNPGTPEETRVTATDPEELGLLVTPNRLILRPEELRAIRVVSLNRDLSTDRIYRVLINPEIGEITYSQDDPQDRGLALKLLAAFDVLITVRPDDAEPDLLARRIADKIELVNEGASNLLMLDGKICPPAGTALSDRTLAFYREQLVAPTVPEGFRQELAEPESGAEQPSLALTEDGCVRLPGRRLYAGNSWQIAADDNAELQFMVRRNAGEDLRGLTVRCAADTQDFQNSDFCRIGGSEADAGAVASSPAQSDKEQKL